MKNFLQILLYCQKELWKSDPRLFILYYLTTLPWGFTPLLWALATKELVLILTNTVVYNVDFSIAVMSNFFALIGVWFAIYQLSHTPGRYIDDRIQRTYTAKFHADMSRKVESLDLQTFEDSKFIDSLDRARNSGDHIISTFKSTVDLQRFTIQSVLAIGALSFATPIIPLVVLVITGLEVYLNNVNNANRRDLDKELTPTNRLNGQYYSYFFHKLPVIEMRIYKLQQHLREKFQEIESIIIDRNLKLHRSFLQKFWVISLLQTLVVDVGIRVYLFWIAVQRFISIDEFVFFMGSIGSFSSSIFSIGRIFNDLGRYTSRLDFYNEFLAYRPVLDYSKASNTPDLTPLEIEFKDVDFYYPGLADRPILQNFSLKIAAGEKVALIGLNGAGKTTLVRLLLRLYDPVSGQILLNGQDVREIDLDHYYKHVGILFQDYVHYELSVRDNVAFGKIQNKDNEDAIRNALELSGAMEFVDSYPQNLDQLLGRQYEESIQPSGGQWQKIALARTFFRDPALLILDEPTSSIDAKAESEIFERVENLSRSKTVLIISHRFSTVRNADRILVLDNGKIVESGTHQQLLSLDGKYAELFNLQASGYR